MAHREFRDESGGVWQVWDVFPSNLEGQLRAQRQDRAIDASEGASHRDPKFRLPVQLRDGWLAFQCQGDCRRLAPIPVNWTNLDDNELAILARSAPQSRTSIRAAVDAGAQQGPKA
jgi:hypothetical protein